VPIPGTQRNVRSARDLVISCAGRVCSSVPRFLMIAGLVSPCSHGWAWRRLRGARRRVLPCRASNGRVRRLPGSFDQSAKPASGDVVVDSPRHESGGAGERQIVGEGSRRETGGAVRLPSRDDGKRPRCQHCSPPSIAPLGHRHWRAATRPRNGLRARLPEFTRAGWRTPTGPTGWASRA
jgi:hypothetical protein